MDALDGNAIAGALKLVFGEEMTEIRAITCVDLRGLAALDRIVG
jgi:hypothetical protein